MRKVFISFLGKARKDQKNGLYHTARYRLPDGTLEETRFFGQAMAKQLQPDLMVLLGTSGSMWDVLFTDLGQGEEWLEERMALIEEVDNNQVREERLELLTPLLTRQVGKPCCLRIIPYGRNEAEQTKILEVMASNVGDGDEVHMDLTHGFRHLPMLGFLSALYLRTVRHAVIGGLYYGAWDMTDNGETPVLLLDGLLAVADWVEAINRHDQGGDYGVFVPLLPKNSAVQALEQASFYERTNNSSQAKEKLSTFNGWFKEAVASLSPAARLFRQPLEQRIAWFKGRDRASREESLAESYLQRKDYLRAVIFGYESLVTRKTVELRMNPEKFNDREQADGVLRQNSKDFERLKTLRNALAHGLLTAKPEVKKALRSNEHLSRTVIGLFKLLFKK